MANGDWVSICLGDLCTKIGSGATPRGGSGVYLDSGEYVLIRSQNVHNDGFRDEGLVFIGEHHAAELSNVTVLSKDVLLNITGDSVARCCQVDEAFLPARVNQHVAIVRPDPTKLDPRFLRYFFVAPEMQARMLSWAGSGGTRNALTKAMIESFNVFAPAEVAEQRAIGHILGALDDKIALNRRMNQTLDAIARSLFASWFINFAPVRANAEGRQQEGVDGETAALFPDRLVESEIGEIPERWQIGRLSDIAKSVRVSVNPANHPEELFSHYSLPAFDVGQMPAVEAGVTIKSNKLLVTSTAVLISKLNPHIPRIWLPFDANNLRRVASTEFMVTEPLNSSHRPFLYSLVSSAEFIQRMLGMVTGTTGSHQRVPPDAILSMPISMPPLALIERYCDLTRPLYQRVHANLGQSVTLTQLRDSLLPRLLSGELRVPTDALNERAVSMFALPEPVLTQSRF